MPLAVLFVVSAGIIAYRAYAQDLTIDETDTYQWFVAALDPDQWIPAANNHLLNTLLMRASIALFDVSPFTLRLPAVLGGVAYAAAAAMLAAVMAGAAQALRRVCLFAALVLNPFVLEYLVAARGYAPALACEMGILLLLFRDLAGPAGTEERAGEDPAARPLAAVSLLAGVAVAANYSFLLTVSTLVGLYFLALAAGLPAGRRPPARAVLSAGLRLFGPMAAVLVLLCGHNIVNMPQEQVDVGWGTTSLGGMVSSMAELTFIAPNPFVVPPHLLPVFAGVSAAAPALFLLLFLAGAGGVAWRLAGRRREPGAVDGRTLFAGLLLAAVVLAVAAHLFLYVALGVKLPRSRTGIHLVPLLSLVAAFPLYAAPGVFPRRVAAAALVPAALVAASFAASLRFSHFQEWKWNADVCAAVEVAGEYAARHGVARVESSWEHVSAGNFYREYLGYGFAPMELVPDEAIRTDGTVYILSRRAGALAPQLGLTPIWVSNLAGTIVAVRDAAAVPGFARDRIPLASRCHAHAWYPDANFYPGPHIY